MLSKLAYAGGEHVTLPLDSKNPFQLWKNVELLARLIREKNIHLVHARSRAPAWSAYLACKRTGVPFLTTFHGYYKFQNKWKRAYNRIMTKGKKVIAISHFIADHLVEIYQVPQDHIRVIPRGVDLAHFNPDAVSRPRMVELAAQWRLAEDLPLILMPGRITRWKGQHILIEALAKLAHRNFCCLLVGEHDKHSNYRKELETLVANKGLAGHVRIAGNTQWMPEAYMLAHVVICPSTRPEAFGRVPIEASAMERPIIATNHGGMRETVIPQVSGWLVQPESVEELTKALEEALALSPEARAQMGREGRAFVEENYSLELMQERTLAVYRELLNL